MNQVTQPEVDVATCTRRNTFTTLLLLSAVFLWALNTIVGRMVHESIPPFSLSFWRWGVAALLIAPFCVHRIWGQRKLYRQHLALVCGLSVLNVTAYNTFQYWALEWIEASAVGIVAAAMPVTIFVFAWLLGFERPRTIRWVGLAIALLGVSLILLRGAGGGAASLSPGQPIILAGVVCFSAYSVLLRRLPAEFDRLGFLGAMVIIGWLAILPFYSVDLFRGELFRIDAANLTTLVFVGVFPSLVANWFWMRGLQEAGALAGALAYNFLPVFVCLLATPVLGEAFTWRHAAGIALVLVGANIHHFRQSPSRQDSRQ